MRAQLSFEYLSVYAWALFGIVMALGALAYFGILNPGDYLPNRCVLDGNAECLDFAVSEMSSGGAVRFFIRNDYGFMMEQTRFNVSVAGEPASTVACLWLQDTGPGALFDSPKDIPAGEGIEFYCPGLCNGTNACREPFRPDGKQRFELFGSFIPEDGQFERGLDGFLRSGVVASQEPGAGLPPDTEPPHITITSPGNNSIVSGTVSFAATAWDNVGVARVEFWNQTDLLFSDASTPYQFDLDTSLWSPVTPLLLDARAFDGAGNMNTTQINVVTAGIPVFIFRDNFNRGTQTALGTPTPGPGDLWYEYELSFIAKVDLDSNRLVFQSNNQAKKPYAMSTFEEQTSGVIEWNFLLNWERTSSEEVYEFFIQLGYSLLLGHDPSTDTGTAVNLRYGDDGQAGCAAEGCFGAIWDTGQDVQLGVVDGQVQVKVIADLDAKEYDVYMDGIPVGGSIPFRNDEPIDAVRMFTHFMGTAGFNGRSVDQMTIKKNVPRPYVVPTVPSPCVSYSNRRGHFNFENPTNLGEENNFGNPFFVIGASQNTVGFFGAAASFDGNDYMRSSSPPYRTITAGNFTNALWFKRTGGSGSRTILSQQNGAGTGRTWFEFGTAGTCGGRLFSYLGGSPTCSNTNLIVDRWYHLALTSNTTQLNLYVDGVLENSRQIAIPEGANGEFILGAHKNIINYVRGDVDELIFWDRELSASEIQDLAGAVPLCLFY